MISFPQREVIEIAGKSYSLDLLREKIISFSKKYNLNERLDQKDASFIEALLEFHPRKDFLKGNGIKYIEVRAIRQKAEHSGKLSFWIIRNDGTVQCCSIKKCLNFAYRSPAAIGLEKFYNACRAVVKEEVLTYKQKYIREHWDSSGFIVSEISGKYFPYSEAEVHHEGRQFKNIVRDFFQVQQLNLFAGIPGQVVEQGECLNLRDPQLIQAFRDFHRKNAILKVVSRKEHHLRIASKKRKVKNVK